jgi:hypothetical protein
MLHPNYNLGIKIAHMKLGMEPFDSPYDAATHYQRRKEYGMSGGMLGAIAGGGLGAHYGKRFGHFATLVGGALGAGSGYLIGDKGTQAAYDWQHNVAQPARSHMRTTQARLNASAGWPSGVETPYMARPDIQRPR